jgi:hypothetical protein
MSVARYTPNPQGFVRSSDLTGAEAVRLFEALSFGLWQFGSAALMNCHIVVLWRTFDLEDQRRCGDLLGLYLNRASKWAAVGAFAVRAGPRRRRGARTGESFRFRWVFVNECGGEQGFHSHVLCTVPAGHKDAFQEVELCNAFSSQESRRTSTSRFGW